MIELKVNHSFGEFMEKNLLLVKYQDNFIDNLSAYASARIISDRNNLKYCYENSSKTRNKFEEMMSSFNLKCEYISQNRASEITKEAPRNKKMFFKKSCYLNTKNFDTSYLDYLTQDILSDLKFKNEDFLVNYDLLEEIKEKNSIGLYINKNDKIDFEYILNSTKRLNKYLKQPILYIFSSDKKIKNLNLDVEYKIINLSDFKEEFYLLLSCKHKIIYSAANSYSEGLWASILNQKEYNYVVLNKNIKNKHKKQNWIFV